VSEKAYIPIEGVFYTNWDFSCDKVFLTREALHKYMKETHGYNFKMKEREYEPVGDYWDDNVEGYGYIVRTVELVDE